MILGDFEKKLRALSAEAQALEELSTEDSAFTTWRLEVVTTIRDVFGLNSLYENEFSKLTFDIRGDGGPYVTSENPMHRLRRLQGEWYLADLQRARGIVEAAIAQVLEKGVTNLDAHKRLTCFLAFTFDDGPAEKEASEVKEFLDLIEIAVITGKDYQPRRISDKMSAKIGISDFGIAIISSGDQTLWSRDEVNRLHSSGKNIMFLVSSDAKFAQGMFGDIEYIPFTSGHIADSFMKILQGIQFVRDLKSDIAMN